MNECLGLDELSVFFEKKELHLEEVKEIHWISMKVCLGCFFYDYWDGFIELYVIPMVFGFEGTIEFSCARKDEKGL